jgi:hypothetical protein
MATFDQPPFAPRLNQSSRGAEQQFQFYLQQRFKQLAAIAVLAIVPYFLWVGIAHTGTPNPANPDQLPPVNSYPHDAVNTVLATLIGGGGLVALWRAKSETDAKAHEFSIKLLTMQKELLESNRTEVVHYFESRAEGITNELKLIRDRLVMLEQDVSQLQK